MSDIHEDDEAGRVSIERSVVLWCMRLWVLGRRRPVGAEVRIAAAFAQVGAAEAAADFFHFMLAAEDGAPRALGIRCVCWRGVGADEHALLDVCALAQEHRPMEALMLLRGLLAPGQARLALDRATAMGAALGRAAWFLDAPGPRLRHFAMGTARAHAPACDIHG